MPIKEISGVKKVITNHPLGIMYVCMYSTDRLVEILVSLVPQYIHSMLSMSENTTLSYMFSHPAVSVDSHLHRQGILESNNR